MTCIYFSQLPDGYGNDTSTNATSPCTAIHGIDCRANIAICQACDTSIGFYYAAGQCMAAVSDIDSASFAV